MGDAAGPNASDEHELISLRAAAKLIGVPRAFLEECIASGRLAVRLRSSRKGTKLRVTRADLESAGILTKTDAGKPDASSLVQLYREQAKRLADVEEQRFHLAGQLGAALERNRMLEERMLQLAAASEADRHVDGHAGEPVPSRIPESQRRDERASPEPPAPFQTEPQIFGAKPAAERPKRGAAAISRLLGVVRRSDHP